MPESRVQSASGVSDREIFGRLWPLFLAAVIGLFPFTIYSTFLVAISETATGSGRGEQASIVGGLRGLGGISALIVGVAMAPIIARFSAPHTTAVSLGLLSATSLVATLGTIPALTVFCLGIGACTAILTPTLLRIATGSYTDRADAGRAATMVTATQSLAAVLAAPVIGVLGLWKGWQGALWATALIAGLAALYFLVRKPGQEQVPSARLGYREALVRLHGRRDLLALIGIGALRTTSFMGYLAFLAAHFHERFALDPVTFTLVWTLSGASFFTGNYFSGRWARKFQSAHRAFLWVGLAGSLGGIALVFTTHVFALALVGVVLMGLSHAVVAALVTTLIAARGEELTTPAYSLQAAGMSLGVFVGASLGGVGLAWMGSTGLMITLALPILLAFALVPVVFRRRAL